jgi:hypothetical protein
LDKKKQAAPASEVGELRITSAPTGAAVSLNGKIVGKTPYKAQVKPGGYKLLISHEGYQNFSQTVIVRKDQTTPIEAPLTKLAKLTVQVKPSGSIDIDGRFRQENQLAAELPGGTYRLKVENRDLGKWEKEVKVEPDQPNEITVDFNKKVQLTVTAFDTEGKGVRAKILIDQRATEYSAPRKLELRVGLHAVAVQLEGYELIGGEQLINFENDSAVQFTLKKIQ